MSRDEAELGSIVAVTRSEEVQEVLREPPALLVRGGVAVALCMLCLALVGSAFVSYPDTLSGHALLVLRNPPVAVVPRVERRMEKLLVREGGLVEPRQRIAVLESSGAALDVLALVDAVDALVEAGKTSADLTIQDLPEGLRLGDLADEYGRLRLALLKRTRFNESETLRTRISQLRSQERERAALEAELVRRLEGQRAVREVSDQVLSTKQKLRDAAVMSALEVLETERRTLADRLAETETAVAVRENRVAELRAGQELKLLEQTLAEGKLEADAAVDEAWEIVRARLAAWRFEHVLEAPVAGRVSFFDVWTDQQVVRTDRESIFIVPQDGEVVARLAMNQDGFGRVAEGQRVVLQIDSYPMHQFGVVEARVAQVSSAAKDKEYIVTLEFPEGLRTSYGTELQLRQGMTALALVITRERSLLARAVAPFRYLLSRGLEAER